MKPTVVLDSSVITKWFRSVGEEKTDQARVYRDQLEKDEISVVVPDLLYYEMINVAKNDKIGPQKYWEEAIEILFSFPFEICPLDREFSQEVLNLAKGLDISAYDACYLTLAKERNIILVTADRELLTKAPDLTKPL